MLVPPWGGGWGVSFPGGWVGVDCRSCLNCGIVIKRRAAQIERLTFDNPKTNLTYEKNLYSFYFKYRAKTFTKINLNIEIKKCFYLNH